MNLKTALHEDVEYLTEELALLAIAGSLLATWGYRKYTEYTDKNRKFGIAKKLIVKNHRNLVHKIAKIPDLVAALENSGDAHGRHDKLTDAEKRSILGAAEKSLEHDDYREFLRMLKDIELLKYKVYG